MSTQPNDITYERVKVTHTSYESLTEGGFEVGDDTHAERELYASLQRRNLMSQLTSIQRRVIICLNEEGMTRRETSSHLMVSLQAIHQIVARIKDRFPEYDERVISRLVCLYWLVYPQENDLSIARNWHLHPWLKDYPKPSQKTLSTWYRRYVIGKEEDGGTKTANN